MSFLPLEIMGIAELAERAGVTQRTIRYYVAEGLLPPPGGLGQNRVYTEDHLRRLQAVKHFKEAFLPLTEIRRRMSEMSTDELEQLAQAPLHTPASALEYIATILPAVPSASTERTPHVEPDGDDSARATAKRPRPRGTSTAPPAESVWHRVVLAPGVELHYQRSGDRRRDQAIAHVVKRSTSFFEVLDSRKPTEAP